MASIQCRASAKKRLKSTSESSRKNWIRERAKMPRECDIKAIRRRKLLSVAPSISSRSKRPGNNSSRTSEKGSKRTEEGWPK
jgi:hypothetical protein